MNSPSVMAAAKTLLCVYLQEGPKNSAEVLNDIMSIKSVPLPGTGGYRTGDPKDLARWYDSIFFEALQDLVKTGEVEITTNEYRQVFYQLKKA